MPRTRSRTTSATATRRVRRVDECESPRARAERNAFRAPGRARRAWARFERARRHAPRADRDAQRRHPRRRAAPRRDDLRQPAAAHVERPPRLLPRPARRQDGPHADAGWCEVAAARGAGTTIYVTILGSPTRSQRNADLAALLRWGLSRYRVARVITTGRTYAFVQTGYGRAMLPLVSRKSVLRSVRIGRPARCARRRGRRRRAPRSRRRPARRRARVRGTQADRRATPRRRARDPAAGSRRTRRLLRAPYGEARLGVGSHDRDRDDERRARPHADRPELEAGTSPSRERRPDARGRQGDQRRARAEGARRSRRRDRSRRRAHRACG